MSNTLYRKYRPDKFGAVIGQSHIITTLTNQIQGGKVSHAYLFSGSRGTGKTTLARIFSRAINCEDKKNFPCGKCAPCLSNKASSNLDIIEIDAASNNGVDDARELREKIKYPPIHGKYKVYIIDEVHSLSAAAFNALLKTLEEPPPHAVMILATTEPHKLPATILSRCLKFDFRLVDMNEIAGLIKSIYKAEGKAYDDEAVTAIAAAAEGSVRDALSIADMAMGVTKGKLTAADMANILGNSQTGSFDLIEHINKGDIKAAIELVNSFLMAGKSVGALAREMAHLSRDLMVAKISPAVLQVTNEMRGWLIERAEGFSISGLAALINLFSELEGFIKYAPSPKIAFEAAVIRAMRVYTMDMNAIDERLLRLEKGGVVVGVGAGMVAGGVVDDGARVQGGESGLKAAADKIAKDKAAVRAATSPVVVTPAVASVPITPQKLWGKILTYFRKNSVPSMFQIVGKHDPSRIKIDKNNLIIFAARDNYLNFCGEELLEHLKRALLSENLEYKIIIEKDNEDIDLEKEISGFYDAFGEGRVKIDK